MKWRMHVAMALMWPGVPVSDWADHVAGRVENTARQVLRLAHDGREGRAHAVRLAARW